MDEGGTGVVGIELAMADPEAALGRAREIGLPVEGNTVDICGVRFELRED